MKKQEELYKQLFGFEKELREFNDKMVEFGLLSADYDVPVGFTMTTDGDFRVKMSLSKVSQAKFKTFYEIIEYVLKFQIPPSTL